MTDERRDMDDPASRLTYWLSDLHPAHYNPRNDIRKVLSELVKLRKRIEELTK